MKTVGGSPPARHPGRGFNCSDLAGRIVEISYWNNSAALSSLLPLLQENQANRRFCAWISTRSSAIYPPDLHRNGIELDRMLIVWAGKAVSAFSAGEKLIKSGVFGLVIFDLKDTRGLVPATLGRLLKIAQKKQTVPICLTHKKPQVDSINSLISLRAHSFREAVGRSAYACRLQVLKDKCHGPGWSTKEVCHAPAGLR